MTKEKEFREPADYSEHVGFVDLVDWLDGEYLDADTFARLLGMWNGESIKFEEYRVATYRAATRLDAL